MILLSCYAVDIHKVDVGIYEVFEGYPCSSLEDLNDDIAWFIQNMTGTEIKY